MTSIYFSIAELASRADIDSLSATLSSPEGLISRHFVLELLLYFLPETLPELRYSHLIHQVYSLPPSPLPTLTDLEKGIENHISRKLSYYGWKYSILNSTRDIQTVKIDELLASFVKCRVRIIDDSRRELITVESLLASFPDYPFKLLEWQLGCTKVLSSFREYYIDHNQPWIPLHDFESASSEKMVKFLLQYSTKDTIFRDLNNLVVPHASYYGAYEDIWKWIGSNFSSTRHLELMDAVISKGGLLNPSIQPDFLRHVIALMYSHTGSSHSSFALLISISKKLERWDLGGSSTLDLQNVHLSPDFNYESLSTSPVTEPSEGALKMLDLFIESANLLQIPVKDTVSIRLNGSQQQQEDLARTFIFGTSPDSQSASWRSYDNDKWERVLGHLKWLQSVSKVLYQISDAWIYETLLDSTLSTANFTFVSRHFTNNPQHSLSSQKVHDAIIEAYYKFYDSATNGNKTRGKMKSAANCLQLLSSKGHEQAQDVTDAISLLEAAHELSTYSLYLPADSDYAVTGSSPNQPITPKEIRLYPDPVGLIHRVLELNPKAYLNMDHLLSITKNLIQGRRHFIEAATGKPVSLPDHEFVSNRIRKMCIEGALVDSNFAKAYEYAIPFMSNSSGSSAQQYKFIEDMKKEPDSEDEIETWASLFQIGKFVSPYWDPENIPIDILEKKMNTLSYCLETCPPDQLSSVLLFWKRLEMQLKDARAISASSVSEHGGVAAFSSSSIAAGKAFYNIGSSVGKGVHQKLSAAVSSAPSLLPTHFAKVLRSPSPSASRQFQSHSQPQSQASSASNSQSHFSRLQPPQQSRSYTSSPLIGSSVPMNVVDSGDDSFNISSSISSDHSVDDSGRKDPISNLLVSGLGWAIGANPR